MVVVVEEVVLAEVAVVDPVDAGAQIFDHFELYNIR